MVLLQNGSANTATHTSTNSIHEVHCHQFNKGPHDSTFFLFFLALIELIWQTRLVNCEQPRNMLITIECFLYSVLRVWSNIILVITLFQLYMESPLTIS
ncbi:hypothetical protein V1527DRAFT_461531 [Lipomyces starkeyi]